MTRPDDPNVPKTPAEVAGKTRPATGHNTWRDLALSVTGIVGWCCGFAAAMSAIACAAGAFIFAVAWRPILAILLVWGVWRLGS
jgi:hypothetical protein